MQVDRARYTPSDIGPSPSDWGAPRLSEVSTLITNGFVGTASPFYSNETGISYLYGTNVRANKIDLNNLRYITREFHQDQQKTSLRAGDLLTVQSGHIGETAVVPKHLENANCHALIVTRLKPKLVNSDFLCQYINSEIGIARLRGLEVGSTIAHINTKDLKKFRIPLPPLPEQKKIAAILSTWDRAIEGTEKLLANSQQQKKALMQQLLTGKKRLPGFTGEWVTKTFSDLFILKIGGTPARSNTAYWDIDKTTENRWVAISDLKSSKIRSTSEHISDLGAQNSNCSLIPKGTIILSFKLTIGKKAILLEDCYTNEAICALIIKDKKLADTRYIYQALDNVNYEEEIDQAVKGKTLNKEKLARLRMSVPPVPEQQAIAAVLSTADEEITAIESDLSRLRQEKKALMQQLLTGKRRVKVD